MLGIDVAEAEDFSGVSWWILSFSSSDEESSLSLSEDEEPEDEVGSSSSDGAVAAGRLSALGLETIDLILNDQNIRNWVIVSC